MEVWKYPVPLSSDHIVIEIPDRWTRFLSLQMQGDLPCLWVLVSPTEPKRKWHFHWVGTGHAIPEDVGAADSDCYVGTVQVGEFVFHLFQSGYEVPKGEWE